MATVKVLVGDEVYKYPDAVYLREESGALKVDAEDGTVLLRLAAGSYDSVEYLPERKPAAVARKPEPSAEA